MAPEIHHHVSSIGEVVKTLCLWLCVCVCVFVLVFVFGIGGFVSWCRCIYFGGEVVCEEQFVLSSSLVCVCVCV